jgi:hypothetical protein
MSLNERQLNAEAIAAAIAQDPLSFNKTRFIKLNANTTTLRLLPSYDPSTALPYRVRESHRYDIPDGGFAIAMDYEFLQKDEVTAAAAVAAGRITEADLEMGATYGDPFTKLARVVDDVDMDVEDEEAPFDEKQQRKYLSKLWPRKSYLWNAVNRADGNFVAVWEGSKSLREKVVALLGQYPELFDPEEGFDIEIVGNGKEGLARRYDSVLPVRNSSKVGFEYEDQMYDLHALNIRACVPYAEKLTGLFHNHGSLIEVLGLTKEDFGAE